MDKTDCRLLLWLWVFTNLLPCRSEAWLGMRVCVCVWGGGGGVYAYCALLLIVVPCLTCLNCDYFITINVLVVSSLYHLHALLSSNTGNPFSQSQDAT